MDKKLPSDYERHDLRLEERVGRGDSTNSKEAIRDGANSSRQCDRRCRSTNHIGPDWGSVLQLPDGRMQGVEILFRCHDVIPTLMD